MTYPILEPQRGKDLLVQANESFVNCDVLVALAPVLADGLVLTYPVLLIWWYIWGIQKKSDTIKSGALYVATSAAVVTLLALLIQTVVDKSRPEGYIDNTELLIMEHLPTAPFPSDHASVGFAVAVSTLLWAYSSYNKSNNNILKIIGWLLLIGAAIMSATRVGVGIHWPTDVLVGAGLGTFVAWVCLSTHGASLLQKYIYTPCIKLQNWIRRVLFNK